MYSTLSGFQLLISAVLCHDLFLLLGAGYHRWNLSLRVSCKKDVWTVSGDVLHLKKIVFPLSIPVFVCVQMTWIFLHFKQVIFLSKQVNFSTIVPSISFILLSALRGYVPSGLCISVLVKAYFLLLCLVSQTQTETEFSILPSSTTPTSHLGPVHF